MSTESETRAVPDNFDEMLNKHFEYTYDNGWKYEFWVPNHERIVYAIHGDKNNYQTAYYQRVRENLWMVSWVEETGTSVTICLDQVNKKINTFMAFSKGHWTEPEKAHGWKNDKLDDWRELSKIGNQTTDRHILPESATIDKIYEGRNELPEIDMSWPTL
ncbi:uncharacterized protein JCM15063_003511 [Sporobolomyces koalae]|uniref:uncharacterized protein n=1 Tax=Sporobolomyces koalae TaxID=500713 RepID=UPI003179A503